MDVLGMDKVAAKTVVEKRPFGELGELSKLLTLSEQDALKLVSRGAVLKKPTMRGKSLNSASEAELLAVGLPDDKVAALLRARPFSKWTDIEDFLLGDKTVFGALKENFYLLANSS
jgi:type II secretory pathway component PulK